VIFRRIPLDDVPTDTDEACAEWLHQHFREKVCIDILDIVLLPEASACVPSQTLWMPEVIIKHHADALS
jgi:hypothetical protein